MNDSSAILGEFGGIARLFPLPNLVLFPHVVQPLHIFEPRYRQMTEHALAGDKFIAIALLKPGWEADYDGRPAVHPVGCLGQIAADQKLPDGKFNLLLRGVCRIRIEDEIPDSQSYRSVRATPMPDLAHEDLPMLRKLLVDNCRKWLPQREAVLAQLDSVLKMKQPLGTLCDILAFALPLSAEAKQELLENFKIEDRVRRLIHELKTTKPISPPTAGKPKGYPPAFSEN